MTLPTDCSGPLTTTISINSWEQPGSFVGDSVQGQNLSGCPSLDFSPKITIAPDSHSSVRRRGSCDLQVPPERQRARASEAPAGEVRRRPAGRADGQPAAAGGLGACSATQIDLHGSALPELPDAKSAASRSTRRFSITPRKGRSISPTRGTTRSAPVCDLRGDRRSAERHRGRVTSQVKADAQTGQLTTVFDNAPKLPFSDLRLDFFGGPRGTFRTPTTCGTYAATSEIVPWSAADPHPTPAETATPSSSFQITQGPNGSPCANAPRDRPNAPTVSVGTENPWRASIAPSR